MEAMLAPYRGGGRLTVLQPYRPVAAETDGDRVRAVTLRASRQRRRASSSRRAYIIDATELGDLLPLTGTEYVTGFESQAETGEPSAPAEAQPDNVQAVSICFAIDHVDGDHDHRQAGELRLLARRTSRASGAGRCSASRRRIRARWRSSSARFTPNPDDDPLLVDADQRRNPGDGNLWTFRRIAARRNFAAGRLCLATSAS